MKKATASVANKRMANVLRKEIENVRRRPDVKQALKQTSGSSVPAKKVKKVDQVWLVTIIGLFVGLLCLQFLLQFGFLTVFGTYTRLIEKVVLLALAVVFLMGAAKLTNVYFIDRLESPVSKYNLRRIVKLAVALLFVFLTFSILFQNWYTAFVSLGLISLILGFALQTPITSFIGWIYILVRTPYRVGDRIKIGEATGDVIDVSYIDTTLWEFGGDFLSGDHPTGRVIKFPNSRVLDSAVYSYTWPVFPYVWNEIKFSVAYESDLDYISETMQRVVEEELGQHMSRHVEVFREILAQTPVNQLEVRAHPSVFFRTNANTWLDAIVRYLVHPKEAGRVKSRLIKRLLMELKREPERVLFPKSNAR